MTALLASVTTCEEAAMARDAGVDLIDLKDPTRGALGALSQERIHAILDTLDGHPTSATIGDLPLRGDTIAEAVRKIGQTGVDFVKIGFFPGDDLDETLDTLQSLTHDYSLIAVLFADYMIALPLIDTLAGIGFKGVMLDTAGKGRGSLTQLKPLTFLERFVDTARQCGLLTGLAGSLRQRDIPLLLPLAPDYLGFRGALCRKNERTAELDPTRLARIRQAIPQTTPLCL